MVLNAGATLNAIDSLLSASGAVIYQLGDPKSPPDAAPSGKYPASARMVSMDVARMYLDGGTDESHVISITVYGAFIDTDGTVEQQMFDATNRLMGKLTSDADLGGNIRNIDAAGELGAVMSSEWGYADIGGTNFRVWELILPLFVSDNQTVTI